MTKETIIKLLVVAKQLRQDSDLSFLANRVQVKLESKALNEECKNDIASLYVEFIRSETSTMVAADQIWQKTT